MLAIEEICKRGPPDLRGTVGRILPATTAYNVIAGEMEIGIDLRAATELVRNRAAEQIKTQLQAIADARNLELEFIQVQDLPACPCDPRLIQLMNDAVEAVGVRPFQMVSGAGHDAMTVSRLAPVAMLFIRCERGVSHNANERVDPADVEIAGRALVEFLERLAVENA